jgi:hypothetical protein
VPQDGDLNILEGVGSEATEQELERPADDDIKKVRAIRRLSLPAEFLNPTGSGAPLGPPFCWKTGNFAPPADVGTSGVRMKADFWHLTRSGPSWSRFLAAQAASILAVDSWLRLWWLLTG